MTDYSLELEAMSRGASAVAGVDEAGRGPLAGPVYAAAAVILPGAETRLIGSVDDSKKLTGKKRFALEPLIKANAVWNVAWASVEEIGEMNIRRAALLAMKRALEGLNPLPDFAIIDGDSLPQTQIPSISVLRGDTISLSVAAASILAKTARDRYMAAMSELYPQYGFERHKGYGTARHIAAIHEYGICPLHRPFFLRRIIF